MSVAEMIGYLASALVFLTFCMRTMVPLRLTAIGSNFAFITYASMAGLYPVLILHLVLLPMNVWRTIQMLALVRRVREAARGDLSVEWLKPLCAANAMPPARCSFVAATMPGGCST